MTRRYIYSPEDDEWLPTGYDGYFVSNTGHVWGPGRYGKPGLLHPTPNVQSGHLYVTLYVDGKRIKKTVHNLVAEAFIPNRNHYPLVRHLNDDPLDNRVENLAWGTQIDNMRDAIRNGGFRYFTDEDRELAMQKRRTPIRAISFKTGKETIFDSQQEASRALNISQSSIHKVLSGKANSAGGYYFQYESDKTPIDISKKKFSRHRALIKAINVETGEERIFTGQTETAAALGMSVASVSTVLSGKYPQLRGYRFEYVDKEENDA